MPARASRRILVVDDSAAVRAQLESLIEPFGFEVEHAEDGAAGLKRCESNTYALVLLDLHMPVLDGPTMLRFMRQRGNQTPVVLVTGASDTKLLSSVIKLGNTDYVCKPFDPRQIHAALARSQGVGPEGLVAETPRVLVYDVDEVSADLVEGAVPPHVAVDEAHTPEQAEAFAKHRGYRLVLLDGVSGGREVADPLGLRLRSLCPAAGLFLLDAPERTSDGRRRSATGPFDGVIPRPPEARVVKEFLYPNCLRNLAIRDRETVTLSAFRGNDEDAEIYFTVAARQLGAAIQHMLQDQTSLRIDLSRAPELPELLAGLLSSTLAVATELSVEPIFIVAPPMKSALTADGQIWPAPIFTPSERG
jgi:CheY-like chemotaxis protein